VLALLFAAAVAAAPSSPADSPCAARAALFPRADAPGGGEAGCAAALLDACDGGLPQACAALGAALEAGRGIPRDALRARALLRRSCGAGLGEGCARLAPLLDADGDRAGAAAAREEGCALGDAGACAALADTVAAPARAAALRERACDLGDGRACAALADAVPDRAAELRARACRLGDGDACVRAALLDDAPPATVHAACARGVLEACAREGRLLQEGRAVPGDGARAAALYARACDGGVGRACADLGVLHRFGAGVPHDEARARALLERACTLGHEEGCFLADDPVRLGDATVRGLGKNRSW
jgi:uncharacterized protein